VLDDQETVALAEVATFIAAHAYCAQFDIRIAIPRLGAEPVRLSVESE
jgi:hypothetical protein